MDLVLSMDLIHPGTENSAPVRTLGLRSWSGAGSRNSRTQDKTRGRRACLPHPLNASPAGGADKSKNPHPTATAGLYTPTVARPSAVGTKLTKELF